MSVTQGIQSIQCCAYITTFSCDSNTSYIPSSCTGFIQVLDVSLNKVLKALVAKQASNHADKYYAKYEAGDFIVGDRRVLLTKWVAEAWDKLFKKYKDTIIRTF